MMACGGAVLASKIGAHQEVCGTTASYFHPEDKDAWRDALYKLHGMMNGIGPYAKEQLKRLPVFLGINVRWILIAPMKSVGYQRNSCFDSFCFQKAC